MKTYYLKIRDKFITDIKNRVKKHEYRLASPERMQAKVGDTFVLISNQNKENFNSFFTKSFQRSSCTFRYCFGFMRNQSSVHIKKYSFYHKLRSKMNKE